MNDRVWRFDDGHINDRSLLPIIALYFSDTSGANEKGCFTLGPIVCHPGKHDLHIISVPFTEDIDESIVDCIIHVLTGNGSLCHLPVSTTQTCMALTLTTTTTTHGPVQSDSYTDLSTNVYETKDPSVTGYSGYSPTIDQTDTTTNRSIETTSQFAGRWIWSLKCNKTLILQKLLDKNYDSKRVKENMNSVSNITASVAELVRPWFTTQC